MDSATPKQFLKLGDHSILYYSIQRYLNIPTVAEIIVICAAELLNSKSLTDAIPADAMSRVSVIPGGKRRQDSVYNGLNSIAADTDIVCIHDAVRPFVALESIQNSIDLCRDYDGAIVAAPSLNTLKECQKGLITSTIDRATIWQAQTPQTFRKDILVRAYEYAIQHNMTATDDASFVEAIGGKIAIVEGSNWNIKITDPTDLLVARAIHEKEIL